MFEMTLLDRIGIDFGRRMPTEDAIEWAAAHGVRFMDTQLDLPPNPLLDMPARASAIRAACERHDIHLGLHTLSGVNIAELSAYMRDAVDDYLRAYIDLAKATGAGWVVVHAGYHFTGDYALRRDGALERLKRACGYAEEQGVMLLLENMNREPDDAEVKYLGSTLEECVFYFDNLDSPNLQWSFTANHAHLWPDIGIDGFLDRLDFSRCREVRLADCRGHVEEHLKPGEGTIDFGAMFKRIEGMGYRGHYMNAWGTVDDMFQGRDYLVARAREAGVDCD
jgi:sugar phosphate isomerase/epimerase